ncbi:MAG: M56 family metallopeptidase, partial [Clostridia bacterium]|nr:M56 family metallopeptidase [Clostridia bacterium]
IMTDKTPTINTGIPIINSALNPVISESFTPNPGDSANPLQIWIPVLTTVWIVGMVALLFYTVISFAKVKRKIGTAVLLRDNIYQSENVVSPFVLGLIKPKIYLPFNMNEKDMEHVVSHEMAHIRRKDHLSKPLGFLLLTLHWFNPLMWLGYVLLCRDIELACDEKVIKELDHDARADYSQALLTCSVNRRMIAACPLAFGEVGVKDRVKSVLSYKKPAFWIIIAAIIACIAVAVCFLTNPIDTKTALDDDLKVYIDCQIAGRFQSDESEGRACCLDWEVLGKKQSGSTTTLYMWVLYEEYSYNGRELKIETGAHIPTVITVKKEDGQYKLIEYWQAKDGSYHVPSIKEKFPWYLHSKALDSQRYVKEQSEKCLQLALDYFGLESVPENNFNSSTNGLIYSFVPPASDSDKLSYVYIQDFGCDVKDVSIDFKQARFEDGKLIFDVHWKNKGTTNVDIGPDFEVYKYHETSLQRLGNKGVWLYYREILPGKGMTVDGNFELEAERTSSYTISEHYDVLTPGKYRFEAYGAWVEFQITDDVSAITPS